MRTLIKAVSARLFPHSRMTDDERRVYDLGAAAFAENKPGNPYPAGSTRHAAWQLGYDDAEFTDDTAW